VMPIIVTNLQNLEFKVTLQKEFFFCLHDNPDTCLWVLLPPCFAWNNKHVRNLYSEDRGNRLLRILQHKRLPTVLEGKKKATLLDTMIKGLGFTKGEQMCTTTYICELTFLYQSADHINQQHYSASMIKIQS
jgi:hypothetical protein